VRGATTSRVALAFIAIVAATPARAGPPVYTYAIVHPTYGAIGTFTRTIDRGAETTRIDSHLRIAVKLMGIVVYRQDSDATEIMRGNKLVSLQCVTAQGGHRVVVHGEMQGDQFVVTTPAGSLAGPAAIVPTDSWTLDRAGDATIVVPDTGRISQTRVTGGDYATVSVNGTKVSAQHFVATGDTRQDVWLDALQVPIMVRTVDRGTAIDFVLQTATATPAR